MRRACVSYFDAQARALGQQLASHPVRHVINVTTMDDASHHITDRADAAEEVITVLASRQRLVVRYRAECSREPMQVQLQVPVAFVKKANAASLHAALVARMAVSAGGAGRLWNDALLRDKLQDTELVCVVYISDAAAANKAIIARELEACRQSVRHTVPLVLHVCCMHHQAALAKKPLVLAIEGLAANLVRLAHLVETASARNAIEMAVREIVRDSFCCVPCTTLPAQCTRSRTRWALLLQEFGSCDLPPAIGVSLLHMLNGDVRSNTMVHYCLPGCCRSADEAFSKLETCVIESMTRWPAVPLLYRWKAFEPALSYTLRNLAMHRVLPRALAIMGRKRAKVGTPSEDQSFGQAQLTRATAVENMINDEATLGNLGMVALAAQPIDHIMNCLFIEEPRQPRPPTTPPPPRGISTSVFLDMVLRRLGNKAIHMVHMGSPMFS